MNLTNALFTHGRIITTLAKAKDVRPFAERIITLARQGVAAKSRGDDARFLHCYRRTISKLQDKAIAKKLFEEIAPGYLDRSGGYTRILKDSKHRLGDNAPRAFFELVEFNGPDGDDAGKGKKGKKAKKGEKVKRNVNVKKGEKKAKA
jgi:large subunit ribosomal protein L17